MVSEHATQTTLPGDDLLPAWPAACVAYREVRRTVAKDHPAWLAARAAVHDARPDLDSHAAGAQAIAAVQYASVFHPRWLWNGVGEAKWRVTQTRTSLDPTR
jgi:hypothetical protein